MKFQTILVGALALLLSSSFSSKTSKSIIVIDAAHGGNDNGSVTPNISEKEITLSVAQKIKALNQDKDIEILLIRNIDEYMSIEQRSKKIQELKPAMVISLHANFTNADMTKSGIEIIVTEQNKHYKTSLLQANQLMKNWVEKGKNNTSVLNKNLHLLRDADCPAMAIEMGYISNETDRNYLMSAAGQEEIAKTISAFIVKQ